MCGGGISSLSSKISSDTDSHFCAYLNILSFQLWGWGQIQHQVSLHNWLSRPAVFHLLSEDYKKRPSQERSTFEKKMLVILHSRGLRRWTCFLRILVICLLQTRMQKLGEAGRKNTPRTVVTSLSPPRSVSCRKSLYLHECHSAQRISVTGLQMSCLCM